MNLQQAVEAFTGAFADDILIDDLATKLTCGEVEILADLFRAVGEDEDGALWVQAHAEGDEDGDEHRFWDDNREAWFDHVPVPSDDPGPGDRCRSCGDELTWIGPSHTDWAHALDNSREEEE